MVMTNENVSVALLWGTAKYLDHGSELVGGQRLVPDLHPHLQNKLTQHEIVNIMVNGKRIVQI